MKSSSATREQVGAFFGKQLTMIILAMQKKIRWVVNHQAPEERVHSIMVSQRECLY